MLNKKKNFFFSPFFPLSSPFFLHLLVSRSPLNLPLFLAVFFFFSNLSYLFFSSFLTSEASSFPTFILYYDLSEETKKKKKKQCYVPLSCKHTTLLLLICASHPENMRWKGVHMHAYLSRLWNDLLAWSRNRTSRRWFDHQITQRTFEVSGRDSQLQGDRSPTLPHQLKFECTARSVVTARCGHGHWTQAPLGVGWASHCRRGRVKKKKRKSQTLYALGLARPRKEATFFSSMWNVSQDSLSADSVAKDIRPWDPDPLHRQNTQGWDSWRVDLQTWGPQGQQLRAHGPSSNEKKM